MPALNTIFKARVWLYTAKEIFVGKLYWKETEGSYKITKNDGFVEEDFCVNDSIKAQMNTIKEIIENDNRKTCLIEIVADFIQDYQGIWYFVSFVNAKFEIAKKKHKIDLKPNLKKQTEFEFKTEINLKQEVLRDLESFMNPEAKLRKKSKLFKKPLIF